MMDLRVSGLAVLCGSKYRFHTANDRLKTTTSTGISKKMHFVYQEQFDGRNKEEILCPSTRDAVPLFRRRKNHMRSRNVTVAVSWLYIACDHCTLNAKIHVGKSTRPVFESFITQCLTGSNVNNLAMFWELVCDALMVAAFGMKCGREEFGHGHFKDTCFPRTCRSTYYNIVIAVGKNIGDFRLQGIKGIIFGFPQ